ncbi:MAG TPA: hypothetical protein VGZ02_17530 [Candidatus Baltobacteraceae bacterium]|jgi:hypothetical protein|nr:hypothetical protein [Candidatus Baltobacteraceae bacterium]
MPDVLVAAIARTADAAELEKTLSECVGLEAGRIKLFGGDGSGKAAARLRTYFVPFRGTPMTSGSDGTNVPGMGMRLALDPYVEDAGTNRLREIGISDDAAYYYNIAVNEGRTVVTYVVPTENATLVAEQFRACGFVKVRRFMLTERRAVAATGHSL